MNRKEDVIVKSIPSYRTDVTVIRDQSTAKESNLAVFGCHHYLSIYIPSF